MGRCFKNTVPTTVATWAVAAAIMAINGSLLYEFTVKELPTHWAARVFFLGAVLLYVAFVIYFAVGPKRCALWADLVLGVLCRNTIKTWRALLHTLPQPLKISQSDCMGLVSFGIQRPEATLQRCGLQIDT